MDPVQKLTFLAVTQREFDLLLGALRHFETVCENPDKVRAMIRTIVTNEDEHDWPDATDVDFLCEGINSGDNDVTALIRPLLRGVAEVAERGQRLIEISEHPADADDVIVTS